MLRFTFDPAILQRKAREIDVAAANFAVDAHAALHTAALHQADAIARDTPRSLLIPASRAIKVHMQDRWTVTDRGLAGVSIDNPAEYAGFVGDYPDVFGARVARYHNRALKAQIDNTEPAIRAELAVTIPALLRTI
jgi:hypothetical protein